MDLKTRMDDVLLEDKHVSTDSVNISAITGHIAASHSPHMVHRIHPL